MNVYLVRRSLPAVSQDALAAAMQRCLAQADQLAKSGYKVRYLGSTYVAADGSCDCLYEASSADVVRLATERAAVPYDDIVAALTFGPVYRAGDVPRQDRGDRPGRHEPVCGG